jgi:hypothetical protein
MTEIHIGAGAGFAGDRSGPAKAVAEALAQRDGERFLIFETLAERTLALAQLAAEEGRDFGRVEALLGPVLEICLAAGIRIVSNIGAADPAAAARRVQALAREQGLPVPCIGIVTGDDILSTLGPDAVRAMDCDPPIREGRRILAANVYLGSTGIAEALGAGAQIVVTGRVADPSLVVGPVRNVYGEAAETPAMLASATMAGHLIECAGQVTGGYFMEPGFNDVPGYSDIGFPIARLDDSGGVEISKPVGSGGAVTRATVLEQLLYEIHDPFAYLTPDITLDLGAVEIADLGSERVQLTGAQGRPAPDTLKAVICWDDGWIGEGEISYGGQTAPARVRRAIEILAMRLQAMPDLDCHFDVIGLNAMFSTRDPERLNKLLADAAREPRDWDLRLRMAVAAPDRSTVSLALEEMDGLYTNGPAGGGGVRLRVDRRIATSTVLVPRDMIRECWEILK